MFSSASIVTFVLLLNGCASYCNWDYGYESTLVAFRTTNPAKLNVVAQLESLGCGEYYTTYPAQCQGYYLRNISRTIAMGCYRRFSYPGPNYRSWSMQIPGLRRRSSWNYFWSRTFMCPRTRSRSTVRLILQLPARLTGALFSFLI
ncbi:uncharacterized protein [Drosophila virilis]